MFAGEPTFTPQPVAGGPQPAATVPPTETPAPSPTETASPTGTVAPTATSSPRPTPQPLARLERGRWLQAIGDCAAARREFAEVATAAVGAEGGQSASLRDQDVSEARYRLAQCYLRDEAYGEAVLALAQLLATAPDADPYRAPATFLLGEASSALGRWADAEAGYRAYLPLAPELASLTWQRIGAVRRAAGNATGAIEAYNAALKESPDWENTVAIRRALADLALGRRDDAGAVAQYDTLRGAATTGAWAAEMQWLAGSALAAAGEDAILPTTPEGTGLRSTPAAPLPAAAGRMPAEALRRWQAAVDADPTSRYAYQAVVALLDAGAPVDEYQRGLVDYHAGVYTLAVAAFDRFRAAALPGAARVDGALYYTGLSYLALNQADRGIAVLDSLIASYPGSTYWGDAWLAKARSQARRSDGSGGSATAAIATYRRLAELRPDAPQAPTALGQAAYLQGQAGDLAGSAAAYLDLARRYTAADEGWRAYQAAGLAYFRLGDWRAAADTWREMAGAAAAPAGALAAFTRPLAFFWLGRAQAALGDADGARRSWQSAAQAAGGSYYGRRASAWLDGQVGDWWGGGRPADVSAAAENAAGAPLPQGDEPVAAWLRTWAGEGVLSLPASVSADPDWRRGQALLALGQRTQGLAAWARVQARHSQEPWTLAALALAFRDADAPRLSILCAEQLAGMWPGGALTDAPAALRRLAYPLPYLELLREQAAEWGLDERLLAAVIRQESRFEVGATSRAGAQGLMQVMPATADWIAGQLGRRAYEGRQAYWPYVNVAFGAYYLDLGLKQFDGSLPAALAGYNGGPGNAAEWRKLAAGDDELMVALIDLGETRVYVQAVLEQYAVYRELYPAQQQSVSLP